MIRLIIFGASLVAGLVASAVTSPSPCDASPATQRRVVTVASTR